MEDSASAIVTSPVTSPPFDLDRIGGRSALDGLIDIVCASGDYALSFQRSSSHSTFEYKTDRSPVTEADHEVQARIYGALRYRYPEIGFLGEEDLSPTDPLDRDQSELDRGQSEKLASSLPELRFIVDPIDGTRAFVRGLTTWSILLGLEDEYGPALGIALMPAAGDLFVGVRGGGAYGNGRPLRVSTTETLDQALLCHGGLHQFTDANLDGALVRLAKESFTQRGFADFDGYRQLLLGRVDAMIDPGVRAWDVCSAAVLVREAGGVFTDLSGAPTIYGNGGLATNERLHPQVVKLLLERGNPGTMLSP
ncbi:MAG: inositol monophosphatase family protein [Myxococcota bacterium]